MVLSGEVAKHSVSPTIVGQTKAPALDGSGRGARQMRRPTAMDGLVSPEPWTARGDLVALAAEYIPVLSPALGGKRWSQVWRATLVEASLRVSRLLWKSRGGWEREFVCKMVIKVSGVTEAGNRRATGGIVKTVLTVAFRFS